MGALQSLPLADLLTDFPDVVHISAGAQPETSGAALARLLGGRAQIVITLDAQGQAWLQSFVDGRFDANYFRMSDSRLLEQALPGLLHELREQLQCKGPAS
jgi:hypothetical protein